MPPVIELNEITKTFREHSWRSLLFRRPPRRVEALRGITLSVEKGEIFGLLGPNGAGKTTLIKILSTLIIPDSGRGTVCGYDLSREPHHIRRMIGLVNTAERSFYWRLTGRQNLDFFASLQNLRGAVKRERICRLLELVGLTEKADSMFMKYSDGQKQRLAIARALLSDPGMLLMDEPTKSLDPIAASDLIELAVHELAEKRGKTVVWCTHNLKEAEEVCSRLAIIHKGRVIASGSLEHMQSLIAGEGTYQMKITNCRVGILEKAGITPLRTTHDNGCMEFEFKAKDENIPSLISQLVGSGVHVHACSGKGIDLEQVFDGLVKRAD